MKRNASNKEVISFLLETDRTSTFICTKKMEKEKKEKEKHACSLVLACGHFVASNSVLLASWLLRVQAWQFHTEM